MTKKKLNLLLYDDEYFHDLRENWMVELHAYEGICTNYRTDSNTHFKITLPYQAVPARLGLLSLDPTQSQLKLYSSYSGLKFKQDRI